MFKKRNFVGEENLDKMDRLLNYLFKHGMQYTFHTGRNEKGENVATVFWFDETATAGS